MPKTLPEKSLLNLEDVSNIIVVTTLQEDQPATVEEYVAGSFVKYVNNDGKCVDPPYGSSTNKDVSKWLKIFIKRRFFR